MTLSSPPSYPMHVRLTGRPVLVAGAGRVATRKIERLVESGAQVHVVAPRASSIVTQLAHEGRLQLALRAVEPADARDKFLVIAATDDRAQNARLAEASRAAGALVSRADAPEDSDFTVPAIARGDNVEVTVATAGAAPSASRRLGRELARWVAQGPDRFAAELAGARRALRGHPEAAQRLRRLAEGDLFEACLRDDEPEIQRLRARSLASGTDDTGASS